MINGRRDELTFTFWRTRGREFSTWLLGESLDWFMLIFQANCKNNPVAKTGLALFSPEKARSEADCLVKKVRNLEILLSQMEYYLKSTDPDSVPAQKGILWINFQAEGISEAIYLSAKTSLFLPFLIQPGRDGTDWQLMPRTSNLQIKTAEAKIKTASLFEDINHD